MSDGTAQSTSTWRGWLSFFLALSAAVALLAGSYGLLAKPSAGLPILGTGVVLGASAAYLYIGQMKRGVPT